MSQEPNLAPLRILVVDDNINMRRLVRALLIGFGVGQVLDADGGEPALAVLRDNEIDVIITDLVMEPMDGIAFLNAVRDREVSRNPYIPVIMLTGVANAVTITAARDAGVTEFLAKPVSAESLFRRLQAVVDRPRPFIRAKAYFGPDRRRRRLDEYEGPERRDAELSDKESIAS